MQRSIQSQPKYQPGTMKVIEHAVVPS